MARLLTAGFLGILGVAIISGCGGNEAAVQEYVETITNVEYFTVEAGTFVPELVLPIVVVPMQEVNLGLAGGGKVTGIRVDKGDRVRRGQLILETDQVLLKAQLDMAQATLAYQESEFARNEQLLQNGSIPQAQFDAVKYSLAQAKSALGIAQKQLDEATLEAPFAGIVTMRNAEIGDILSPGAPAFRIINVDQVKIQAGIPEKYIHDFETGSSVAIALDAIPDHPFEAKISYISPEADPSVRTFPVEMVIDNREGLIRAGLMGNARISQKPVENAILIPLNAIVLTQEGPIVYVLNPDSTVSVRRVQTLNGSARMTLVNGLTAGERIVSRGQNDVSEGETVNVAGEYNPESVEENQE